jgi:tetratricopeptide (TPR) repeat protein
MVLLGRAVVTLFALGLSPNLLAQLIDQVDVQPRNGDTEVVIRFSTTVQYERHQPASAGSLIKIEFQQTGPSDRADGRLLTELRRVPASKTIPSIEVSYDGRGGFLTVKFGRSISYRVGPGEDPRSIRILLPGVKMPVAATPAKPGLAAAKPAASPPPPGKPSLPPATKEAAQEATQDVSGASASTALPMAAPADVESDARESLLQAKAALKEGRAVAAIDLLNRVLNLPPTKAAQEAQELIGQAREANGEISKARAEYELYLKLYPNAAEAGRVRTRLAGLGTAQTAGRTGAQPLPSGKPEYSFFGSASSYYYHGSTKYDATLAPPQPGLNFDQISLTGTDQSALVSNIDLNGRVRAGGWDNKIVVRDTQSQSFLSNQKSYNRLNNAYVETLNKGLDFFARAGRQSSPGYGVLGRFDGAWLRYGFNAHAKFDLVAGEPVEFYAAPKKKFIGGAVDIGPFADRWSGNAFFIEQRVDGLGDRRAVGSEIRYLDPQKNGFALFDYDLTSKALNIALLQGNWQLREGTSFNFLFDRRRSPILQLTNSLNALPLRTVQENIDSGITLDELRNVAKVITPTSTLFSVGVTHQLTPAWQLGGDIKYSEVSGTGAIGSQIAQEGTGKVFVYGLQAIRTGALTLNDIIVATTNIIRGNSYNGESYQLSHVLLLMEKWRIESTLKYYHQTDIRDNVLDRLTPSVRVSYRWFDRLSVEGEAGAERSKNRGPAQTEKTMRRYYNLGMRYDFF